jgi:hypothetical protein
MNVPSAVGEESDRTAPAFWLEYNHDPLPLRTLYHTSPSSIVVTSMAGTDDGVMAALGINAVPPG